MAGAEKEYRNGSTAGARIVSFNHFLVGPTGAQILGDLGADVIAVEPLGGAFQRNWSVGNKRSIAPDLKAPAGLEVARKLVQAADVMMENFRPGTMEKLGLGYEDMAAINPGDGATQRLARWVRKSMAMKMILSGEMIDATEAKVPVLTAFETPLATGLEFERRNLALAFDSDDQKEGMWAFVERRKPLFRGT